MSTTSFYQHGFHVREFGSEGARSIFQDAQSGTPPELMPQDEMSQYDQGWSLLNKWQIIVATIFQVFSGRMCRIPHINGWLEFAPSIILRAIAIQKAMKSGVNTFQQQKHYRQMTTLAHLEKAQTMLQSDRSDMASDRLQWWDEIEQWQLGEHGIGYKWANALVPPTPFQGWRKKCADIEPLKKPSKRLGRNIVKHTYVYIYIYLYITLYVFHSQKWNDDRNWGILMTSLWRRHQDEILWNTPRHPRPSNAHVSCWDPCSYSCFICAKGCEGLSW